MSLRLTTILSPASFFLATAALSSLAPAQQVQSKDVATIRVWLREIKSKTDAISREDSARGLANSVQKMDVSQIDTMTIDEIANLLEDDSDEVRGWMAMAPAHIGPRAERAFPALELALSRAEEHMTKVANDNFTYSGVPIFRGHTSADEICYAFKQTGTKAAMDCSNGSYDSQPTPR